MNFREYFEKLCQEYMFGASTDKEKVEAEILAMVSNTANLNQLFQTLRETKDEQCTLFIGLELLNKTYLNDTKVGLNNSSERLLRKERPGVGPINH